MADDHNCPRVLVVGPVGDVGGMAAVARQTADAARLPNWDIRIAETAENTTPGGRSRPRALWHHLKRFAQLTRSLVCHRPHLAHVHTCSFLTFFRTMPDILACRLLRSKVVLHIHGGFFDSFLEGLGPLSYRLVCGHLRLCCRVILLGETWRARLTSIVPGLAVEVVPNAIDTARFSGCRGKRHGNRVLFVGDLARTKGIDDLIDAIRQLPDDLRQTARIRVVGDGPAGRREALQRHAETLDVSRQFDWLGVLEPHDVLHEYEGADVFVLPSYGEGMPISLFEAMASALPSVVTDVGAVTEVVRHGVEALIGRPGDAPGLANHLTTLLRSRPQRRAMGVAAFERARCRFDLRRFYSRLDQLWRDIAGPALCAPARPMSEESSIPC